MANLDWLAVQILDTFSDAGIDKGYIEEKAYDFKDKDRAAMIRYCANLDSNNLSLLADKLKINLNDFRITIKTVCQHL
jgi:hypothetical protein